MGCAQESPRTKTWSLRALLDESLQIEFCSVQPCLARTQECAILIHVDDIMHVGSLKFWNEFKEKLQQRFTISCSVLEGVGTEISFLKRKILRVEDGLSLLPGNNIAKLIKVWEEKLRADPGIQIEDSPLCLVGSYVTFFRMGRPDIAFTVKELLSYMSSVSDAASQET